MSDTDASLNASFWVMVLLRAIGAFEPMPGTGVRKMPAPGRFVPVIAVWGILQLTADVGFEEGAAKFGWLVVLASLILGSAGRTLAKGMTAFATIYGNIGSPASTGVPMGASAGSTY